MDEKSKNIVGGSIVVLLLLILTFLLSHAVKPIFGNTESGSALIFDHSEVNWGSACSYYNISNPYLATLDSSKISESQKLQIDSFNIVHGELKSAWWEVLVKNIPYNVDVWKPVIVCTNETVPINDSGKGDGKNITVEVCTDKGGYVSEVRYKDEYQPLGIKPTDKVEDKTDSLVFSSKETKQIRFCGTFDMEKTDNGWSVSIDHIPSFLGTEYKQFAWWNATFLNNSCIPITQYNGNGTYYLNITTQGAIDQTAIRWTTNSTGAELEVGGAWYVLNETSVTNRYILNATLSNGTTNICYYYGNTSAVGLSSANNISKACAVGDDFQDASLDTTKWFIMQFKTVTEANGIVNVAVGGTAYGGLASITQFGKGSAVMGFCRNSNGGDNTPLGFSMNVTVTGLTSNSTAIYATAATDWWVYSYTNGTPHLFDTNNASSTAYLNMVVRPYNVGYITVNGTTWNNSIAPTNTQQAITIRVGNNAAACDWICAYHGTDSNLAGSYNFTYGSWTNGTAPSTNLYFVSPTPTNNTNNFTYGMVLNMTSNANITFTAGSLFDIDGANFTCSISADTRSCSYALTAAQHIVNHTYIITGHGNIAGAMVATNSTLVVPYYGCGYVHSNGTLLGNVSINGSDCFTIHANNIVFDGAGYTVIGDKTRYGIISNNYDNNIYKNFNIENFTYGFYFIDSMYNALYNNSAYNNTDYNFYFDSGKSNNFTNNTVYNSEYGFYVSVSSTNIFVNNSAYNNTLGNFNIYSSSDNIFSNNSVYNSPQGFYFTDSGSNMIYNNNITNSSVFSDDITNNWNITKTLGTNIIGGAYIGGNYYSDYVGYDDNDDGLGETNYSISGVGVDYLPLTKLHSIPTNFWIWKNSQWSNYTLPQNNMSIRCGNPPTICEPVGQTSIQPIFRNQNNGTYDSTKQIIMTNTTWGTAFMVCNNDSNYTTGLALTTTYQILSNLTLAPDSNESIWCYFNVTSVNSTFPREFNISIMNMRTD